MSIGEPAGIGPDVVLIAFEQAAKGEIPPLPAFVLLGDPQHLSRRASLLGLNIEFSIVNEDHGWANHNYLKTLAVLPLINPLAGEAAAPNEADSAGIVEAIATAVSMIKSGRARGIVTLPINKKSLYESGFDYPGHTEYLGALAESWQSDGQPQPVKPVMMLAGPALRAVPVTIHIPLMEVPAALTRESIVETVMITERDLRQRFSISAPRIAVSGLNPHAGESGTIGKEDQTVIAPAIAELKSMGIDCFGPLPADTMFHAAARKTYDAAVCMYHDQALIPAKALAFDETVNVTLGLPFVRTSPDHGTAFDIAGTGKANPASLIAALRMAHDMTSGKNITGQSA